MGGVKEFIDVWANGVWQAAAGRRLSPRAGHLLQRCATRLGVRAARRRLRPPSSPSVSETIKPLAFLARPASLCADSKAASSRTHSKTLRVFSWSVACPAVALSFSSARADLKVGATSACADLFCRSAALPAFSAPSGVPAARIFIDGDVPRSSAELQFSTCRPEGRRYVRMCRPPDVVGTGAGRRCTDGCPVPLGRARFCLTSIE